MNGDRQYDIVVYGATGVTGQRVAQEVARQAEDQKIKWAIAGRDQTKLESLKNSILPKSTPIIICDSNDTASIVNCCKQTKVIINCVGPFRFHGEQVVKACIDAQCDYVDICGEPQFIEGTALKYHQEASKKGICIVPACGFDSVPADVGTMHCMKVFKGKYPNGLLTQVESFVRVLPGPKGAVINYATYESAVHGFGDQLALSSIRKALTGKSERQASVKRLGPALRAMKMGYHSGAMAYVMLFPGADSAVVRNSQVLYSNLVDASAVFPYYAAYYQFHSRWYLWKTSVCGMVFSFLAQWKCGRNLLLKFPGLFTWGVVKKGGPTEEQRKQTSAEIKFIGKGFKEEKSANEKGARPDAQIKVTMSMPDPGYVATPIYVVESALTLLKEKSLMCIHSGVLTPGVAFRDTTYVERLKENRIVIADSS